MKDVIVNGIVNTEIRSKDIILGRKDIMYDYDGL